ncbi:MAG: ATP-binding cassette domain-containing protein [Candidatus Hydrothermarchaeaceae archaeon]
MSAIVTDGLTKKFGKLTAVGEVSIEIEKGELFGLLGPNGAGKTTLISMLCTMLKPTEGRAEVSGHDIVSDPDRVRSSIGIVFQDPSLDEQLTGRENLDFHGRLYGLKHDRKERMEDVLKLVDLSDRGDSLVKTYSGGMRRRLELARGLMHHPDVLFLDEPTLGLDPQTRWHIWEYIKELKLKGVTIIITTHYMDEADYLCDRVAIIDHGEIIALDTPERLKSLIAGDVITIEAQDIKKLIEVLKDEAWVEEANIRDGLLKLNVRHGEARIPKIIEIANKNGVTVDSVGLRKPTLEDIFIHLTGRTMREERSGTGERLRTMIRSRRR